MRAVRVVAFRAARGAPHHALARAAGGPDQLECRRGLHATENVERPGNALRNTVPSVWLRKTARGGTRLNAEHVIAVSRDVDLIDDLRDAAAAWAQTGSAVATQHTRLLVLADAFVVFVVLLANNLFLGRHVVKLDAELRAAVVSRLQLGDVGNSAGVDAPRNKARRTPRQCKFCPAPQKDDRATRSRSAWQLTATLVWRPWGRTPRLRAAAGACGTRRTARCCVAPATWQPRNCSNAAPPDDATRSCADISDKLLASRVSHVR